jgi:hypothetical protein
MKQMVHKFKPGMMYRMPTEFGPSLGPRQGLNNVTADGSNQVSTNYSVDFLTNPRQLEDLLPDGFSLDGDPVVHIRTMCQTGIGWLAGRGYNLLEFCFPAQFNGKKDHVFGEYQPVLWEESPDGIVTGREDIGFHKMWCHIPNPIFYQNYVHCTASWFDFKFMDMKIFDLKDVPANFKPVDTLKDGKLLYKYMPKTEDWGQADASYPVLSVAGHYNVGVKIVERKVGNGTVQFHKAEWEDLPTLYQAVNTIAALEIREYVGASKTVVVGTSPVFARVGGANPARILK